MQWFKTKSTSLPIIPPDSGQKQILDLPAGAFPFRKTEVLLNDEKSLIARIRLNSGISNEMFERLYVPLLTRYAEYIQTLPASRNKHHFAPGGLWQYSLEVALLSLQTADSKIFSGSEPVELRHQIEPRWRFASFCAGLLLDVGIVISHMRVLSSNGITWEPLLSPLYSWGAQLGADYYYIQWLPEDDLLQERQYRMFSGVLANRLLPPEILSYLCEGNTSILHEMVLALSGLSALHSQNTLLQIIDQSRNSSIELETKSRAGFIPTGTIGLPVETYLLDAIRSLAKSHWKINMPGSLLWVTKNGLFICWEEAVPAILNYLERQGLHTMPKMASTLAEILLQHKMAISPTSGKVHDMYWSVEVPGKGLVAALMFSSPELIFGNTNHTPVEITVLPSSHINNFDVRMEGKHVGPIKEYIDREDQTANSDKKILDGNLTNKTAVIQTNEVPDKVNYDEINKVPDIIEMKKNDVSHKSVVSLKTPEESLVWLRKQGKSGEILAALAEDCKSGRKRPGIDVFWVDSGLAVIFPSALVGNGFDPAKALSAIRDKGWVVANQKTNKSILHDISVTGGVVTKALILTPTIGSYIAAVAGIIHPTTNGTRVPRTNNDLEEQPRDESVIPKDFFDLLLSATKDGKIKFLVEINEEGVKADYPDVFHWYARQQQKHTFTEIGIQLTTKDLVLTKGRDSVFKDEGGKQFVVFKRDYCPQLFSFLVAKQKLSGA